MDAEGNLNAESAARAACAAKIYTTGQAPLIVTCGWAYRDDSTLCIADAFASHLESHHGVPKNDILVERSSRDTVGDAVFTKINFAIPHQWKNLLIITSDYHVVRTQQIFRFIYGNDYSIQVVGSESNAKSTAIEAENLSLIAFKKTFDGVASGDTGEIIDRLSLSHPFYNGQVYEKIPVRL